MAECDFRVVLSFLQLLEALHNPHLAVLLTVFCSTRILRCHLIHRNQGVSSVKAKAAYVHRRWSADGSLNTLTSLLFERDVYYQTGVKEHEDVQIYREHL